MDTGERTQELRIDGGDPMIGRRLGANGQYLVLAKLGEGGMATVYRAGNTAVNGREVAIKFLRQQLSQDSKTRKNYKTRFRREVEIMGQLKGVNIAAVLDCGETADGEDFLVMELLEGDDLAKALYAVPEFGELRAVRILLQVCQALDEAHRNGIIHRDLKPDNIFLVPSHMDEDPDLVKVMDFGVAWSAAMQVGARLTKVSEILGTPAYMPPEQALGDPDLVDHRADIYAMGVILFELMTHTVPYEGTRYQEILVKAARDPIPSVRALNAKVSIEMEAIITKALAKRPEDRFQNVGEMRKALKTLRGQLTGGRVSTPPEIKTVPAALMASPHAQTLMATTTAIQPKPPIDLRPLVGRGLLVACALATVGLFVANWKSPPAHLTATAPTVARPQPVPPMVPPVATPPVPTPPTVIVSPPVATPTPHPTARPSRPRRPTPVRHVVRPPVVHHGPHIENGLLVPGD